MELAAILESMRLSLIANTALVAFGFVGTTLMLYRQGGIMRDVSKQVSETSKQTAEISRHSVEIAAMARESHALLQETHALTAKATAALENVTRLVVHAGGRTP